MRKTVLLLATAILFAACGGPSTETPQLKNEQDTLSWAMGRSLAETVQGEFYSFTTDMKILIYTIGIIFQGRGK